MTWGREDGEINFSLFLSVGFHAAGAMLYFFLIHQAPRENLTVVTDVDVILPAQMKEAVPVQKPGGVKPTTWNFLKMALPQMPSPGLKTEAPELETRRSLNIPSMLPEEKKGRVEGRAAVSSLPSLSDKSRALADAASRNLAADRTAPMMASAALDFEEVGSRRAPALPSDLTMEEAAGLPKFRPKTMEQVQAFAAAQTRRPSGLQAPSLPGEAAGSAAPASGGTGGGGFSMGTPAIQWNGSASGAGGGGIKRARVIQQEVEAPTARAKQESPIKMDAPTKPAEITGPLSGRKILKAEIPKFPAWARERGILEAVVAIRFFVSRDGRVLPEMRVERSSGYGQLDQAAMDALKKWVFAPAATAMDKEWGIITFKFLLE